MTGRRARRRPRRVGALFLADRRAGVRRLGGRGGARGRAAAAASRCRRWSCQRPAPMPRRSAQAFDGGRLAMLARGARAARRASSSAEADVYASVAGGVRVAEPGADLAVALAVAGARRRRADRRPTRSSIGELGLGGEVRQVPQRRPPARRSGAPRVHARDRARVDARRPGIELRGVHARAASRRRLPEALASATWSRAPRS